MRALSFHQHSPLLALLFFFSSTCVLDHRAQGVDRVSLSLSLASSRFLPSHSLSLRDVALFREACNFTDWINGWGTRLRRFCSAFRYISSSHSSHPFFDASMLSEHPALLNLSMIFMIYYMKLRARMTFLTMVTTKFLGKKK